MKHLSREACAASWNFSRLCTRFGDRDAFYFGAGATLFDIALRLIAQGPPFCPALFLAAPHNEGEENNFAAAGEDDGHPAKERKEKGTRLRNPKVERKSERKIAHKRKRGEIRQRQKIASVSK